MNKKLVIIGLDGVSPNLIEELVKRNKIPNIKKIIDSGVFKPLKSTMPPQTIPAWPCMFSGKNPGDLGYFGMYLPKNKDKKAKTFRISGAFWKILNNKKVGLLNIPATYPVEKVNGFMMSGMLTPTKDGNCIYPVELKDELKEELQDFEFSIKWNNYDDILNQLNKITKARFKILNKLYSKYNPDILVVVENGTDWIQHFFMKFIDKKNPFYEKNDYETKFYDYFERVDEQIGTFLSILPKDVDILIVSDHGGQFLEGSFHLNEWLRRNDYLKITKEPFLQNFLKRLHINMELLSFITEKTKTKNFFYGIARKNKKLIGVIPSKRDGISWENFVKNRIDWSNTLAYSPNNCFVYFNNCPFETRKEIIDKLRNERKFKGIIVREKEEIYNGRFIDSAPDLIVYDKEFRFWPTTLLKTSNLVTKTSKDSYRSGSHGLYGIFICNNKNIVKKDLEIQYVFEYILKHFGVSKEKKNITNVLDEINL